VVERNIKALLEQRQQQDEQRSWQDRTADAVTTFAGSMTFVLLHLAIFGAWIVVNLGWVGIEPFDPSFVVLAMVASVEAIFLSTFVLITQNRMAAAADKRAELDLHVSLLAEHEVTHLIRMTSAIARRMGIADADHPEIDELSRNVAPEVVMDRMEEHAR
jgi:uncharacterized membrane protein